MLIFGGRHRRLVLAEHVAHYNGRRPHRSRQLYPPQHDHPLAVLFSERIKRRPVLDGVYQRAGSRRSPGQDRWPSSGTPQWPALMVSTYFGEIGDALPVLAANPGGSDQPGLRGRPGKPGNARSISDHISPASTRRMNSSHVRWSIPIACRGGRDESDASPCVGRRSHDGLLRRGRAGHGPVHHDPGQP